MDAGKRDQQQSRAPSRGDATPPQPGYSTPQIRLKRSGQFGSNSSTLDASVPAYATLPRNRTNAGRPRNMLPATSPQPSPQHSPQHSHSPGRMFESASRTLPKQGARTLPKHEPRTLGTEPGARTLGTEPGARTLGTEPRTLPKPRLLASPVPNKMRVDPDELQPVMMTISSAPCKVHRISKEEQLAKQEERRKRKHEYFQTTPSNKLKITQRDLEAYVLFYEKKLAGIVQNMDVNIAEEQRKKDRLEARLKFLLDDNDTLAMELAGIRNDLKKFHTLTETPV